MFELDTLNAWIAYNETLTIAIVGLSCTATVLVLGRFLGRKPKTNKHSQTSSKSHALTSWHGKERRANPRQEAERQEILLCDPDLRNSAEYGLLVDRSLGGLGIELRQPIEVGEKLRIRPLMTPPETPWILVEIRYCRKKGRVFRIGCQFVESTSWDVMSLFGPRDPDED